jgi:hypothetical protein
MIRRSLLVASLVAAVACSGSGAQNADESQASPSVRTNSAPSVRAFFGITTDPDIGPDAWLVSLDTSKRSGSVLIPPVMAKLASLRLGPGEAIEFETESLFEKHCQFRGVLTANRLNGKIAIIEDEGAHKTLAEYPLTADEILTGPGGDGASAGVRTLFEQGVFLGGWRSSWR